MSLKEELKESMVEETRELWRRWKEKHDTLDQRMALIDCLPDLDDLPVERGFVGSFCWPLYIVFPLDRRLILKVDERFQLAGWKERRAPRAERASYVMTYRLDDDESSFLSFVSVEFKDHKENDNCQLVPIGEEKHTVTRPVYELRCMEEEITA